MSSIIHSRGGKFRATVHFRFAWLAAALALATAGGAPAATSAFVNGIRLQDEIVVVNVRPAGSCCDPVTLAERVRVESYQIVSEAGVRRWQSTDLGSVLAVDPGVSTVIFVHGNRLTAWDAKCEGLAVYRRIVRRSADDTPIRFVVFSWPSSQIGGPLNDVRVKAARTRPAGCQLAWLVDQLPAETPITMVGFSFGARIITGSLHVLGGSTLGGLGLSEVQHPHRRPVNAVLLAAALNSDWLCPGRYHGQAMTMVNQMLLVNNCADRAMKFYHFSATNGRPQALGLHGPACCLDANNAAKIATLNVSRYVGQEHDVFCYLSAPGVTSKTWAYASAHE